MTIASLRVGLLSLALPSLVASAQTWRQTATGVGASARVLIIGARPEDEDNALIAWLSLGRNVETAYLSLTRGESANNVVGTERQAALGVVRTAELLAERKRDGAHQYFTRAYDFGPTRSDSIVGAAWPHDSLLADMVSIIRAFRPHVIISTISDSTERDATRRMTARLAREAYAASGAADPPGRRPGWNTTWAASRFFTLVRDDASGADITRIDVGEFDRTSGKSYAELGAEIRRLQRSQAAVAAPPVGRVTRALRLDNSRGHGGAGLFDGIDTTWQRFKGIVSDTVFAQVDTLRVAASIVRTLAARSAAPDTIADALARVLKRVADVRSSFSCTSSIVPRCPGVLGDLAVSADRVRVQATDALMGAAGIVVDGTVDRQLVAVGDSVRATATIYNGGTRPVAIKRVAVDSRTTLSVLVRDSSSLAADSVATWSTALFVRASDLHWWQANGLIGGTYIHAFASGAPQMVAGEDRIARSGVEATFVVAGVDVPVLRRPLVQRDVAMVRGDDRHPLTGVTALSILLERTAEYERAGIPVDRLFRVFLASPKTTPETVTVSVRVPAGLRIDSAARMTIVPAQGTQNVFFRLRGMVKPGSDSIFASASLGKAAAAAPGPPTVAQTESQAFTSRAFNYGSITHEYPHIPSLQFIRSSKERVESVDLKVPAKLRVGYVKGTDDVQTALGQLQVNAHALDPSLVSVVDLSFYSTILIGAGAMSNEALASGIPALRDYMNRGGAVVVMAGGDEVARSGLLPYPITFDSEPHFVSDPTAPIRIAEPMSQLLSWPNAIRPADFDNWSTERARNLPLAFDAHYHALLTTGDAGETTTASPLLVATVGRGTLVFSSLSVDRELNAVHAGAARLFINLLSAGLRPGSVK